MRTSLAVFLAAATTIAGLHTIPSVAHAWCVINCEPDLVGIWIENAPKPNVMMTISKTGDTYVVEIHTKGLVNGTFSGPYKDGIIRIATMAGDLKVDADGKKLFFGGATLLRSGDPTLKIEVDDQTKTCLQNRNFMSNDIEAGIKACSSLLTGNLSNGSRATVLQYRGMAYAAQSSLVKGAIEKAIADYAESLKLDDRNVDSYLGRAEALSSFAGEHLDEKSGEYRRTVDQALADLNSAIRLAPQNWKSYQARANFFQHTAFEPAKAVPDLTRAITLNPDYGPLYLDRAKLHRSLGDKQQAIADLRTALQNPRGFKAKGLEIVREQLQMLGASP